MADVVELLEHMQDVLDTLFRASFKEPRMLHFFRLLGGAIDGYVQQAPCAPATPCRPRRPRRRQCRRSVFSQGEKKGARRGR